ncbi:MAG: hypothetical protein RLZZ630_646 [Bacteroidota bacterium]|jgi:antitoxin MazE
MELALISIGNSKGIRIPKAILEKYQIQGSVEIFLEKGHLVLKPKRQPRKNWDKAFKKMHADGEDKLLIPDVFMDENFEEWS